MSGSNDIVGIIVVNVISFFVSCIIFALFSEIPISLTKLVTDWLFKRIPTIKLILFIIEVILWGYLITKFPLDKGDAICFIPGILLGYTVIVFKQLKKGILEYHREIKIKMINNEMRRIPQRLNKFISKFGYLSDSGFKKTFYESYIFRKARKLNGYEFSTPVELSTNIFSCFLQKYQIRVNQDLQKHLTSLIPTLQVFGIDDLYELSPAFQEYYHVEPFTEQIPNFEELVVGQQILINQSMNPYEKWENAANIVIVEMINQGLIEKIPQGGLYKSTKPDSFFSSKDAPGAVVEGTTLEI